MACNNAPRTASASTSRSGCSRSTNAPSRCWRRATTASLVSSHVTSSTTSTCSLACTSSSSMSSAAASRICPSRPTSSITAIASHASCASGSVAGKVAPRPLRSRKRPGPPRCRATRSGYANASSTPSDHTAPSPCTLPTRCRHEAAVVRTRSSAPRSTVAPRVPAPSVLRRSSRSSRSAKSAGGGPIVPRSGSFSSSSATSAAARASVATPPSRARNNRCANRGCVPSPAIA